MSSSTPTPTPASRNGEANKSASNKNGGVAIPLTTKSNTPSSNGSAAETKPDWTGPKAIAGPSAMPFGGDRDISREDKLNLKLSSDALQFEPALKPAPINFLNRGSTEDETPVIVSSTNPTKPQSEKARGKMAALPPKPIGTRDGTTSPTTPTVFFTTDNGPGVPWLGGHYIRISNIRSDEVNQDMAILANEMGWRGKILGQKADSATNDKILTLYFAFDDIQAAKDAGDEVSLVNQEWIVRPVGQPEYAAARDGSQEPSWFFDGQVNFVAVFEGALKDIDTSKIPGAVRALANHYGQVMAFSEAIQSSSSEWRFRVEYTKITSARQPIAQLVGANKYNFEGWAVTAEKLPEPHHNVAPSAALAALNLTPRKGPDGTTMSPTGRTAWGTDADGNIMIKAPVVKVPKISNPADPVGGAMSPTRDRFASAPTAGPSNFWGFGSGSIDASMDRSLSVPNNFPPARPRRSIGDENEPQTVNSDRIRSGVDVRTTIMLRNLPNLWTAQDIKTVLDAVTAGQYDFSYLRIDFEYNTNVGYAFVNFTSPEAILAFCDRFVGKEWERGYHPRKIAQVSYATVQGIDCLIEKFRNSAIMSEFVGYIPKLWWVPADAAAGLCQKDQVGQERAFPEPNNATKKQRSLDNAGTVGLYAPRSGNRGGDRTRRSNYDRGTTRQLQEDAAYQHGPMSPFDNNYALNGARGPIGPPPFMPMMPYGYPPMGAPFYPQFPMGYGQQEGMDPFSAYQAQQPYAHPNFMPHPHPAQFGAFPMAQGNPASRLRTISRGRLGGRPTNVTIAERGYSDVDADARLHVPRSFTAGGHSNEYFGNYHARGSADGNVSPGNAEAGHITGEES